ncbi:MAG: hypothetical protein V1646_04070 [bacterium]
MSTAQRRIKFRCLKSRWFIFIIIFFTPHFTNLYSGSLGGSPGYFAFQPVHNVFYNRQSASGFVRLDNGFTVTVTNLGAESKIGSSVILDTCISVSGAIDLRETNTIFLQSDLILDHGVTFSSSGNIYGYDRSVILHGDLTIPDGKIIHTGGRIVIDGNGHKLLLGNSAQLFIDTDATLTLRNLVLQNTRNQPGHPAVQCASSGSKLCLDDVELAFSDDFYFNRGQLFIHNDVAVTGTSAFVYRSTNPSHITADSVFYFNPATTLDFRPSTAETADFWGKDLLFMDEATSQLYLNGCTLKTTMTGICLTKGQLIFDNKVSITSAAQLKLNGMGSWLYVSNGDFIESAKFSPDGRYLATGSSVSYSGYDIYIYDSSLNVIEHTNYGGGINSIDWSPDGRYLAVGGATNADGDELQIYSFDGSSLTLIVSQSYGHEYSPTVFSVNWSPDGRYLAIGGQFPTSEKELQVYRFDGVSLSLVADQYGQIEFSAVLSVNWSPDGRYLAEGEYCYSGGKLRVYGFDGSSLSLVDEAGSFNSLDSINWSSDGLYLALGVDGEIQVYEFYDSSLGFLTNEIYGNDVSSVNWSPDGRYLAIGGGYPDPGHELLEIYSFDGSDITITTSEYLGTEEAGFVKSVNWSADGKKLAVGGSTFQYDHGEVEIYTLQYGPETQTQALSNSIVFGNSALGSGYDLNVRVLAGAQVAVDGLLNDDNVN